MSLATLVEVDQNSPRLSSNVVIGVSTSPGFMSMTLIVVPCSLLAKPSRYIETAYFEAP